MCMCKCGGGSRSQVKQVHQPQESAVRLGYQTQLLTIQVGSRGTPHTFSFNRNYGIKLTQLRNSFPPGSSPTTAISMEHIISWKSLKFGSSKVYARQRNARAASSRLDQEISERTAIVPACCRFK